MPLPAPLRRHLAAAALAVSAGLGLAAVTATPAFAATAASTAASAAPAAARSPATAAERVVRDQSGQNTLLVPDRVAVDAGVGSRPRIGASNDTPIEQTWQTPGARGGGINIVAGPTAGGGGQLCLDVRGDSPAPGAPLVLRPCDGSAGQTWRALSTSAFTPYENKQTGLKMELVGGRLVQSEFPDRNDPDFRQRTRSQGFSIVPKSFGVGGA